VANAVGTGAAFSAASVADALLIAVAFTVPSPRPLKPQPLRAALPALRDRQVMMGSWLMALAGIAFGTLDVLAPLRLSRLGVSGTVIAATFLCGALVESGLSPLAGRLSDRHGAARPLTVSLAVGTVCAIVIPLVPSAPWLIGVLIAGTPFYGTLFAPASALVASGAEGLGLNQGIAFALSNLTWAAGQSVAAAASGALAQATSDLVPYTLLAAACLGTFIMLRGRRRASELPAGGTSVTSSGLAERGAGRRGRRRGRQLHGRRRKQRERLLVREREGQFARRVRVQRRRVRWPLHPRDGRAQLVPGEPRRGDPEPEQVGALL
jgi:MFS family permease